MRYLYALIIATILSSGCINVKKNVKVEKKHNNGVNVCNAFSCEPLSLNHVIALGSKNSFSSYLKKRTEKISNGHDLTHEAKGLSPHSDIEELNKILYALNNAIAFNIYRCSYDYKEFIDVFRKAEFYNFVYILTETYWKKIAADDHFDYVSLVSEFLNPDTKNQPQLKWAQKTLQMNTIYLKTELSRLMCSNNSWQFSLDGPKIESIISSLPYPENLDIGAFEDFALAFRAELLKMNPEFLMNREQVWEYLKKLFPKIIIDIENLSSETTEAKYGTILYKWSEIAIKLYKYLINSPFDDPNYNTLKKEMSDAKLNYILLSMAVITQVNISFNIYSKKYLQFRMIDKLYKNHMDKTGSDCYKNDIVHKTKKICPEVKAALLYPKFWFVLLNRDDAIIEMLLSNIRLNLNIGKKPIPESPYLFFKWEWPN